ncbi:MAG: ABC transporter permease [Anaerolineae bacterium]|nr:ABC transporter permease [Anaerolineae bacterium]
MWKYLLRRLSYAIFTLWVVSVIAFFVIQLPPGDYVSNLVRRLRDQSGQNSDEFEQRMREIYGFDDPLFVQYYKWMRNIIFRGDFGYSFIYRRDAGQMIMERLPMSAVMALASFVLVWSISLPLGIYAAVKKYSIFDYSASFIGFVGLAIPNFVLALIALYASYRLTGQAAIGLFSKEYVDAPWSMAKFWDLLGHLWVPALVVGLSGIAGQLQTMRANLLDELNKPYVNTARSKGLSEARLLWKYPVRHALNPFISTIGWILPSLVSGEAIVSMVLNLPTSGPMLFQALTQQDQYVAAGFILLLSSLTIIGTFVSDLLLAALDPRIRLQ